MAWQRVDRVAQPLIQNLIICNMEIFDMLMVRTGHYIISTTCFMERQKDVREPVVLRCRDRQRSIMALIIPAYITITTTWSTMST